METVIFDGKSYAASKEVALRIRTFGLKAKGITPHLVSIIIGDDPASKLYVNLKKKAAERIGAELEIYEIGLRRDIDYIVRLIKYLNTKEDVHGIMVQLPLPKRIQKDTQEIIDAIAAQKDVDGLKANSPYLHPTSKAVLEIFEEAKKLTNTTDYYAHSIVVVGATGMVGKPLVQELEKIKYQKRKIVKNYEIYSADSHTKNLKEVIRKADTLISTTGVAGLVTADMLRRSGVIAIDVGSPVGDFKVNDTFMRKCKFLTPVPGGVGPVTITCLLENLLTAAEGHSKK